MYIYRITNTINQKKYIGQTNNPKRRWANHRCYNDPNMVIARALKKYGKENFKFEILLKGLSPEEANRKEIELIEIEKTLVPKGYNVSPGGGRIQPIGLETRGENNSNAHLSKEEAQYILDNRDQPMYVLYEKVNNKIGYDQFRKLYHHQTYKNLTTETEEYPFNDSFSNQFSKVGLEYDEVLSIRERYKNGEYWKKVYEDYRDIYTNEWSFWNAYNGISYKLVMPEVFTEENKHKHSSYTKLGAKNGRSKLTEEQVLDIRRMWSQKKPRKEIYDAYPQVSAVTVRDIINGKTWKHLL